MSLKLVQSFVEEVTDSVHDGQQFPQHLVLLHLIQGDKLGANSRPCLFDESVGVLRFDARTSIMDCPYDFLLLNFELSPSGDSDGELLAKFCGQTIPRIPIVVFTPDLWVHFQTDASQGDLGFKAKYLFSGKTLKGLST